MVRNKNNRRNFKRSGQPVVLVVCEGEVTELTYFRAMKKELKTPSIEIIVGKGSNPKSILETAMAKYSDFPYDQIFCVFDKDSHLYYQSVINEIEQLNNRKTNPVPIKAIYSAPCFEYWLLLHFDYTAAPYQRTQKKSTGDCCVSQLKKHIPNYDKSKLSIIEIFPMLYGRLDDAIKNAKKIQIASKRDGFDEPFTNVNEIVEYFRSLSKKN